MYRRLFSFIKPKYQIRELSYNLSEVTLGIGLLAEADKKLSKYIVHEGDTAKFTLTVAKNDNESYVDMITSYVQEYYPKFQIIIKRTFNENQ